MPRFHGPEEDSFPLPFTRVEVRCKQARRVVITNKDYMELVPILAHVETSDSGIAVVLVKV